MIGEHDDVAQRRSRFDFRAEDVDELRRMTPDASAQSGTAPGR